MSGFGALHARRVLDHPLRTVLTLVGISGPCALLVGVLALSGSLTGSIARTADLAGRADVQVSGVTDTGFDEGLLVEVEHTSGAAAAVPYVQTPATVGGVRTLLVGFDTRAEALGRAGEAQLRQRLSGRHASTNGVVAGPELARLARLHTGTDVTVAVASRRQVTRLLGVLPAGPLSRFNRGVVAVATLPTAQRLAGRPQRLNGIYVVAAAGVSPSALERRVADVVDGRAVVSSPRLLADQAATASSPLRTGLLTVSVLALLVAGFVVFNTMNMAALERRPELATLRALGGRRRVLLLGFLAEAGILGLAGASVGVVAGIALARSLVGQLPSELVGAFDVRIGFILPRGAIPLALVLGTGLAIAAALVPARRAVRVAPVEAMRPEGVLETHGDKEGVRWPAALGGLAALVAAIVLSYTGGRRLVLPEIALFWVGGIVATFGFAGPLAALAAWLAGRFGTPGRLAATSLARAPRRAFITASAIAAAVALVVAQTGTEHNVNRSLTQSFRALNRTAVVVTTANPQSLGVDQLLPDRLAGALGRLAGVARVATGQDTYATIGTERVLLRGVGGDSALPELRLAPSSARRRVLDGSAVVLTSQYANHHHLRAGDTLGLPTPSGTRPLPVAAIVGTFATDRGNVLLSLDHLQAWYARPGLSRIELTAARSADRPHLRRSAAAAAGALGIRAQVQSGQDAAHELEGPSRQVGAAFDGIELIIIVGAGLALLNTLAISMIERRWELGILRAVGTSRRQVRRSVLIEAGAIGTLGTAIGVSLGVFAHRLAVLSTQRVGGLPVTYRFDPTPIALAAIAAFIVTIAGAQGPAWRSGRLNVVDAIEYE